MGSIKDWNDKHLTETENIKKRWQECRDDTTLMVESEEQKSLLITVKEESEKIDLKLKVQKTRIMVSSPITSWQIDGETWKQWQTLFWGAPKSLQVVTSAMKLKGTYSLEGKLWPT